jgi:hypothetical protein
MDEHEPWLERLVAIGCRVAGGQELLIRVNVTA